MNDLNFIVRDLQRRLANMIRRGKVHSVDFTQTPPRVRVDYGVNNDTEQPAITDWLPWISGRASTSRVDWEPLSVGEQVLILSESGELSSGVVVPAIASANNAVPSTSPDEHISKYSDSTEIKYDRLSHKLTITIGSDGDAELTCKTFIVNADIEHTGNQKTSGNLEVAKNVDVKNNITAVMAIKGESIADKKRTMSEDRDIYNQHTHPHDDPVVPAPNQKQ
ncbi:phage baseplate assembly protein V [Vibrio furnissii]|uniref:phage baseplate assembly protein V n=1 Tax=Vibrio furnissii TaxID=29494 RepID=UPI0012ADC424|nr:phage baseplate assembly protein V [Vibrio furnissii]